MRFRCSRAKLHEALSLLCNVVPPRSSKPVLQNIVLRGNEDGTLSMTATDLEIAIRYRLEVEGLTDPEELLLPAVRFSGIVRDDWSETVSVSITDCKTEIETDNGRFHLLGAPVDDFPPFREMEEEKACEIQASAVMNAIGKTSFATAKGDARYALNGIFLRIEDGHIEFVASDTHRLSLVRKKAHGATPGNAEAIVITKGMVELSRLCQDQELIKMQLTSHELLARTANAELVARLVDGQFPRYRDVIPKDLPNKMTMARELLNKTLRLVGQMTNEESHSVTIAASGEKVLVSASGSEAGDARVEIDGALEGEEVATAFNYHYLMDVIKVLEDDNISIRLVDGDRPVRIDEGDFTHIIMPIKPAMA